MLGVTMRGGKPYNPHMQPAIQTQGAPTPAQAPAPPASITTVGADGKPLTLPIPRTQAEIQELRAQRSELAGQLSNVASRRSSLAEEISRTGNDAIRPGLEQRLAVLDARILQIETDLAITGRQISSAPAELLEYEEISSGNNDGHFEEGMLAGGLPVLFAATIAFFFARRRWKKRVILPAAGGESSQRLERLEHGMDAIALEIERISEGQRFVTKLLSEAQPAVGQPQRIPSRAASEREDPAKR